VVWGLPQMGKLKAYLFGFFASFYLVAAAWFSVGPVVEFARWVGLGGLDWVLALVVFLALLHLAVEVTSSLRRNRASFARFFAQWASMLARMAGEEIAREIQ
jgi:hypothetical protein